MTPETESLVTDLASQCPFLTKEEWAGFIQATPDDQKDILLAFQLGQVEEAKNGGLQTALSILNAALAVASAVSGLAGAISAVEAVIPK